jgi:hypothetical protein
VAESFFGSLKKERIKNRIQVLTPHPVRITDTGSHTARIARSSSVTHR